MKERRRQGRNRDLHKDSAQIAPQKRILLKLLYKGGKPVLLKIVQRVKHDHKSVGFWRNLSDQEVVVSVM